MRSLKVNIEQLEKHEIVKALLMGEIKDKKENKVRHNGQLRFAMKPKIKYKSTVSNNV